MSETPQTIERWKLDLIRARAFRRGFRGADLDDAQQEIAIEVMAFTFEKKRSNGATEATALTALVDRRLSMIRRQERRYRQRFEPGEPARPASAEQAEPAEPSPESRLDVVTDTRDVLKHLAPEDQEFCRMLAGGMTIDAIAGRLGCGWHTVRRRIERLRAEFERMGLDGMAGQGG